MHQIYSNCHLRKHTDIQNELRVQNTGVHYISLQAVAIYNLNELLNSNVYFTCITYNVSEGSMCWLWCVLCTPANGYVYDLNENSFFSANFIETATATTTKSG